MLKYIFLFTFIVYVIFSFYLCTHNSIITNILKANVMKYTVEESLRNFNFWSGARENAQELTLEQLDEVEFMLEDIFPDGMTDTDINDLFWFEFDIIKGWLGIEEESEE